MKVTEENKTFKRTMKYATFLKEDGTLIKSLIKKKVEYRNSRSSKDDVLFGAARDFFAFSRR